MKRRVLAGLFLLVLILPMGSIHAQTTEPELPPYLYYYSSLLGGLIIERADGTDSRHIAADVLKPITGGITGPGWSPSGRYFAAYGITNTISKIETRRPIVIDTKGEDLFGWSVHVSHTSLMQWSPTGEDILLMVGSYYGTDSYMNPGSFFWILDVENRNVLADFGANFGYFDSDVTDIIWDVANLYISFYMKSDVYGEYYYVTMHFDGTTIRKPVTAEEFQEHYVDPVVDTGLPAYTQDYGISPSGRYIAEGLLDATLSDDITGSKVRLPHHSNGITCAGYVWDEDEDYIIIQNGTMFSGGGCGPSNIGVTNKQGKLWRELTTCTWDTLICANWLPERVDVAALPPGSPEPVLLDPVRIEEELDLQAFNNEADRELELHCDQDGQISVMRRATQEIIYSLQADYCPFDSYNLRIDHVSIITAEDSVHDLLAIYSEWFGTMIWRKNMSRDVYEQVLVLNTLGLNLEFTENFRYLRAKNIAAWKVYAVSDILERIEQANSTE